MTFVFTVNIKLCFGFLVTNKHKMVCYLITKRPIREILQCCVVS
jgi:hypothetical protein